MQRTRLTPAMTAAASALVLLPVLGMALAGHGIGRYLEFPPLTRQVSHPGFSWTVFTVIACAEVMTATALGWAIWQGWQRAPSPRDSMFRQRLPWWGWLGLISGGVSWWAAWTRPSWLATLQPHTFIPLWFSYVLVVNALCVKCRGRSLLTHHTRHYLLLFPLSAVFWWLFEFLNRFVQNWYYVEAQNFTALEYVLFATVSFSTVLPAVIATRNLLLAIPALNSGLMDMPKARLRHAKPVAITVLGVAAVSLLGLGLAPSHLFPFLWVAPLLVIVAMQVIQDQPNVLNDALAGDWRDLIVSPLAALACGGLWELWNWRSLAHWEYSIPFVDRFHVFEMPVLGYGGYLPFGLECTVIATLFLSLPKPSPRTTE